MSRSNETPCPLQRFAAGWRHVRFDCYAGACAAIERREAEARPLSRIQTLVLPLKNLEFGIKMANIRHLIRDLAPGTLGDVLFTILNYSQYRVRHSGEYVKWRNYFRSHLRSSAEALEEQQLQRLRSFLRHCVEASTYYRKTLEGFCVDEATPELLRNLAVLEKAELRENINDIATIPPRKGIVSTTGGTTGNSMAVIYRPEDMQERFALIDVFRERAGYRLGGRIAWATGKEIVSRTDLRNGRYFRKDMKNRILFVSTFHLNDGTFDAYWKALVKMRPEYLLGFPSFFHELGTLALRRGLSLSGVVACFPTAETVMESHREVISQVFGCKVIDQYASSEGAPFILQCERGRYHLQPHTGVFEVVDEAGHPSRSGELLVTSFSTRGTPLVRYRIGDSVSLSGDHETCLCGFGGRLVERIEGRGSDFILTPSGAKITSVNLSNATKGVRGIELYQVQQCSKGEIVVRVVANAEFDGAQERGLIAALKERVGVEMLIGVQRVDSIERERSGKFRVVKPAMDASV